MNYLAWYNFGIEDILVHDLGLNSLSKASGITVLDSGQLQPFLTISFWLLSWEDTFFYLSCDQLSKEFFILNTLLYSSLYTLYTQVEAERGIGKLKKRSNLDFVEQEWMMQ